MLKVREKKGQWYRDRKKEDQHGRTTICMGNPAFQLLNFPESSCLQIANAVWTKS